MNAITPTKSFSILRLLGGAFLASALLFFVGCDSNGGMDDPDPDPDPGPGTQDTTIATYDTTQSGGQTEITVQDDPDAGVNGGGIAYVNDAGDVVTDVTWTSDNIYILDGFVFVNDGQTLTIEPGTIIKGSPGQADDASAFIVADGGTIIADGNPDSNDPADADPIIFTAEADDPEDDDQNGGLGRDVRGQWGGVILLGNAGLNTQPGTQRVEGIPDTEPRGEYGGGNNDHDVGVFRFVQIRHTGAQLGPGDEIQGLTLGGLGRESTVEWVETYASSDDGFEWFGGTVNTKYLISAFNADDAFDIDQGHRGNHQFWFVVQSPDAAGRGAEQDGGTDPEDGQPFATAKIVNATYVGVGPGTQAEGDNNNPFVIHRDNNASSYFNSVFVEGGRNAGLQIEDLASGADSRQRQEAGDQLVYENTMWWNIGPDYSDETTFEDIIQLTQDDDGNPIDPDYRGQLANYLRNNDNEVLNVAQQPVTSISRAAGSGGLDPRAAGPAMSGAPSPPTEFENDGVNGGFESVDHFGAFGPDDNWAQGWTTLDRAGFLPGN